MLISFVQMLLMYWQCLDANLNDQKEVWEWDLGSVEDSDGEEDRITESNELQARPRGGICRQCDPHEWVEKYLAKDEGSVQGWGGPIGVMGNDNTMDCPFGSLDYEDDG